MGFSCESSLMGVSMADEYQQSWLISAAGPLPIMDEPADDTAGATFPDVIGQFAHSMVYVEYTAVGHGRCPVAERLRGMIGTWIFAYSSYAHLLAAHNGDDEFDYSEVRGATLIAALPDRAGIWLDYGFRGGHRVISAQATPEESTF